MWLNAVFVNVVRVVLIMFFISVITLIRCKISKNSVSVKRNIVWVGCARSKLYVVAQLFYCFGRKVLV